MRSAYAAHTQHQPRDGWVEHDANEIWACTQRVIADVVGDARIDGVALANQGETCLVWDAKTGEPLHRALVWSDTRTGSMPDDARVRALTGLRMDPYFSAPKMRWLLDHTRRDGVRIGTLDAWLLERLTGTFATDASTAARTLLCEIDRATWSAELCERFGVPIDLLPEIRDTDGGFGACAGNGLDGVPLIASVVDQPGALMGQGCLDRGDAKATFGTGCFVYVNSGDVRLEPRDLLSTIAWRRVTPDGGAITYALDGGVLAVGSALAWARGLFGDATEARRESAVICVPAIVGLGAPHWNREARAAWFGMSPATTSSDLIYAVQDGICCRVAEVIDATGVAIEELRVDGGLTRDAALMQRQADVLGKPIVVAEEDEATVVGACALAALRMGTIDEAGVRARKQRTRVRYVPREDAGAVRARFARALAVVRADKRSV